ncbi:histidine triad (HIT) protein [Isosphaera pallida ATCC 43644]|uniref:Histidine triad (HIT) protein n=1 Tax=Isosphaera pallida (strain ATCC 43644 / DSM 9630 / IS1B) TaxID=575540 RepID=E8R0F6_ISOPI|nr:HIT domain-containing protein [Isosphaera pallida]ADV63288.1 histidine triad (HIT) protein [Isosphaera pallida ATCC 43644]
MDQLWAPWRVSYILGEDRPPAPEPTRRSIAHPDCFLCRGLAEDPGRDRVNGLVWRRSHSMVWLNRYPYNNGHLLIAPIRHQGDLTELDGEDLYQPLETLKIMVGILREMLRPQGFNIGLNLGKAAGAGLPGHLHWHVVPRWDGDTNFMPVLAGAKVIVESLESFYDRLIEALGPRRTVQAAEDGVPPESPPSPPQK